MDVNDSDTVKLGEVRMHALSYEKFSSEFIYSIFYMYEAPLLIFRLG